VKPDVIWRTLELAMRACPSLSVESARVVELEVRAEFAGQRTEIWKSPYSAERGPGRSAIPAAIANAVIRDILAEPKTSTDDLARRHGIHRATIYRLMKRGPKG
jgi:transcriptional regulator of acetoin/glycerol metabolism